MRALKASRLLALQHEVALAARGVPPMMNGRGFDGGGGERADLSRMPNLLPRPPAPPPMWGMLPLMGMKSRPPPPDVRRQQPYDLHPALVKRRRLNTEQQHDVGAPSALPEPMRRHVDAGNHRTAASPLEPPLPLPLPLPDLPLRKPPSLTGALLTPLLTGVPLDKCVSLLDTPELIGLLEPQRPMDEGDMKFQLSSSDDSDHTIQGTDDFLACPDATPPTSDVCDHGSLTSSNASDDHVPNGLLSPQWSPPSCSRSESMLHRAAPGTIRRKESLACLDALLELDGCH